MLLFWWKFCQSNLFTSFFISINICGWLMLSSFHCSLLNIILCLFPDSSHHFCGSMMKFHNCKEFKHIDSNLISPLPQACFELKKKINICKCSAECDQWANVSVNIYIHTQNKALWLQHLNCPRHEIFLNSSASLYLHIFCADLYWFKNETRMRKYVIDFTWSQLSSFAFKLICFSFYVPVHVCSQSYTAQMHKIGPTHISKKSTVHTDSKNTDTSAHTGHSGDAQGLMVRKDGGCNYPELCVRGVSQRSDQVSALI